MYLFLILLWYMAIMGRFGGPNPISRNSRFGESNSRLGVRKFPIRGTTGIWSQGIDLAYSFLGQPASEGAKSTKFPSQREKPGNLQEHLGRVLAEDPRADFTGLLLDPMTECPVAAARSFERVAWQVLDPDYQSDFDYLTRQSRGDLTITSMGRCEPVGDDFEGSTIEFKLAAS
jgi:hypothetical protein